MVAANNEMPEDIKFDPDTEESMTRIKDVKERHEDELMTLPEVTGVGIGQNEIGDEAIIVYLQDQSAAAQLPSKIEGFEVLPQVTGIIDAQEA